MNTLEITPGEWDAVENAAGSFDVFAKATISEEEVDIATVYVHGRSGLSLEMAEANRHLILAAPTLYKALDDLTERVGKWTDGDTDQDLGIDDALDALMEARGVTADPAHTARMDKLEKILLREQAVISNEDVPELMRIIRKEM
jgi:hypothetical protein